jgi:hypothetical protein
MLGKWEEVVKELAGPMPCWFCNSTLTSWFSRAIRDLRFCSSMPGFLPVNVLDSGVPLGRTCKLEGAIEGGGNNEDIDGGGGRMVCCC